MKNGSGRARSTQSAVMQTGLGRVMVNWDKGRLASIQLERFERVDVARPALVDGGPPDPAGERLIDALAGYFSGEPVRFHEVPICPAIRFFRGWSGARPGTFPMAGDARTATSPMR